MDKKLASVIRHLFIALLFFGISFAGVAQKDSKSVQSLKRQQQTTKQQIANTNKQIDKTKKSQISALHKLEALSTEIAQVNDSIGTLNAEIADLSAAEKKLAGDVSALERNLEVKKKSYANAIRSMTVRRDSRFDALMFIFSAHSLEQAYRRFRYLQEFSAWRKQEAHEIAAQRDEINRQRSALKQMQNERKFALTQRTRMSNRLTRQKKEQNVLIAGLKKKEKELQQELKRQQRQAEALGRRIQEIIKEEARKAAEKAAAAKKAAEKNNKASTGYKMSQDEINLSQNFAANKGKLPTPLSGRYRIVSHYGTHRPANDGGGKSPCRVRRYGDGGFRRSGLQYVGHRAAWRVFDDLLQPERTLREERRQGEDRSEYRSHLLRPRRRQPHGAAFPASQRRGDPESRNLVETIIRCAGTFNLKTCCYDTDTPICFCRQRIVERFCVCLQKRHVSFLSRIYGLSCRPLP